MNNYVVIFDLFSSKEGVKSNINILTPKRKKKTGKGQSPKVKSKESTPLKAPLKAANTTAKKSDPDPIVID